MIEDHFDKQFELEDDAEAARQASRSSRCWRRPSRAGETSFTRQQEPLGLGHAVWCARDIVGDEPFALLLPDMLIHAEPGSRCIAQMMDVYADTPAATSSPSRKCRSDRRAHIRHRRRRAEARQGIPRSAEWWRTEGAERRRTLHDLRPLHPGAADLQSWRRGKRRGRRNPGDRRHEEARRTGSRSTASVRGSIYDTGNKLGFLMANVHMAWRNRTSRQRCKAELKKLPDGA